MNLDEMISIADAEEKVEERKNGRKKDKLRRGGKASQRGYRDKEKNESR